MHLVNRTVPRPFPFLVIGHGKVLRYELSPIYVELPIIPQGSTIATVLEGESVDISCTSSGNPIPTISWELRGSPASFPQKDAVTNFHADVPKFGEFNFTAGSITSVLTITGANYPEHEGTYKCIGRNSHRGVESNVYSNITVHVLGTFLVQIYMPVMFVVSLRDLHIATREICNLMNN